MRIKEQETCLTLQEHDDDDDDDILIDHGLNNHIHDRLRSHACISVGQGIYLYQKLSLKFCSNNGMIVLQYSKFKLDLSYLLTYFRCRC